MDRDRLFQDWQALRAACRAAHTAEMKGRMGAAVVCVCGHGCGGCAACGMLSLLRSFLIYANVDCMCVQDREFVEVMREIV